MINKEEIKETILEHRYGLRGVVMVDEHGDTWIKADPLIKDLKINAPQEKKG